jgi:hypothetical protein
MVQVVALLCFDAAYRSEGESVLVCVRPPVAPEVDRVVEEFPLLPNWELSPFE